MQLNNELSRVYNLLKIISREEIEHIVETCNEQSLRLDKELLNRNLVTEEDNAKVYAQYFKMPYCNLDQYVIDRDVVKRVSSEFVSKNGVMPITYQNGKLLVVISDPFDFEANNKMFSFIEEEYVVGVSVRSQIKKHNDIIFSKELTDRAIQELQSDIKIKSKAVAEQSELEDVDIKDAPAVKLTDSIIREAITLRASDIHIEPFENIVRVRYRIDGVLHESTTFDKSNYPAVSTRIKIMAGINIAERRIPQDGRIKMNIDKNDYDFRVSTLPTVHSERIVIRILDTTAFAFDREHLDFLPEENLLIDKILQTPHGIILLTGPTGCGKSTTLYSFIKELNKKDRNIITVEDPVEYTIQGVNQVQVNPKANLTFASTLRSILRQDPNVIMIGEIRDEETAQIAIRAAITGHLVLSTLHTNDAAGSITRLIDMGVEPYFVADAVVGVIAQRLIRRVCKYCRQPIKATAAEAKLLEIKENTIIYAAKGCPACNHTGYHGRMGIHEILYIDAEMREMIQQRRPVEHIKKKAVDNGMLTLWDTCRHAVLNGDTTVAELATILYDKE